MLIRALLSLPRLKNVTKGPWTIVHWVAAVSERPQGELSGSPITHWTEVWSPRGTPVGRVPTGGTTTLKVAEPAAPIRNVGLVNPSIGSAGRGFSARSMIPP